MPQLPTQLVKRNKADARPRPLEPADRRYITAVGSELIQRRYTVAQIRTKCSKRQGLHAECSFPVQRTVYTCRDPERFIKTGLAGTCVLRIQGQILVSKSLGQTIDRAVDLTKMLSGAYGIALAALLLAADLPLAAAHATLTPRATVGGRERVSINAGWRFQRFTSNPDSLSYNTLKSWILPSGNDFIKSSGSKKTRPTGTQPGANLNFTQASFNDASWEAVNVPHDWAIKGLFNAPGISGAMGKLPSNGVGWYRRVVSFSAEDAGKTIFLDVDGAMSYAAVWLNGNLVGGWPFGYASFRLDLTPYVKTGADNILAIRLDNPLDNSRWYPGAGIYRNVWLVKSNPVHVAQYGTFVTTPTISSSSATVSLTVDIENKGTSSQVVDVVTEIRPQDESGAQGSVVATLSKASATVAAGGKAVVSASATVANPKLWGPPPNQTPNLYVAITTLSVGGQVIDT